MHDLKSIRLLFALALALTLLSLLLPGDQILAFKQWAYNWIPFAQQLDDVDVTYNGDKVVHACLFASLGYLAIKGWVLRSQLTWVLAGLVWLAPQSEWAQAYIPGRGASVADVAADVAGLAVGVGWALWRKRLRVRGSALVGQNLSSALRNSA